MEQFVTHPPNLSDEFIFLPRLMFSFGWFSRQSFFTNAFMVVRWSYLLTLNCLDTSFCCPSSCLVWKEIMAKRGNTLPPSSFSWESWRRRWLPWRLWASWDLVAAACLWSIWQDRNYCIFQIKESTPVVLTYGIYDLIKLWSMVMVIPREPEPFKCFCSPRTLC